MVYIEAGLLVLIISTDNQMVRQGYKKSKTIIQEYTNLPRDKPLLFELIFFMDEFSGVVPIFTIIPIDTVKTKTQSLNTSKYISTLNCFTTMFKEEDLKIFWKTATTKLRRLILSGEVFFTIFEKILVILG